MSSTRPRLITIPISHYCEKARWALERAGLRFTEDGHLPFFSRLAGLRHGAWYSVPILRDGAEVVPDSTAILKWADARTAPEGATTSLDVVVNDTDVEDGLGNVTIVAVGSSTLAETSIDTANNRILYSPFPGTAGIVDNFLYVVEDSAGAQSTAMVSVCGGPNAGGAAPSCERGVKTSTRSRSLFVGSWTIDSAAACAGSSV